eukprot:4250568-Pyramimonas_sp.AAC.2
MSRQRAVISLAGRLMRPSMLAPAASCMRAVQSTAVAGVIAARNTTFAISRGFTASSLRADKSEKALLTIIASESDSEKQNYETPEELKEGPPKPFQLVESENSCELVLTREFDGEKISVTFVANDDQQHEMSEDFEAPEGEEEELEEEPTMFFTVDVTKPSGTSLSFDCVTNGADIEIRGVNLIGESSEDMAAYTGPDYEFLDERLQEKFDQYLEARGVDLELAGYMMDVCQDKEQREYMTWLANVESFLKE